VAQEEETEVEEAEEGGSGPLCDFPCTARAGTRGAARRGGSAFIVNRTASRTCIPNLPRP
jgi:hypothetical protein